MSYSVSHFYKYTFLNVAGSRKTTPTVLMPSQFVQKYLKNYEKLYVKLFLCIWYNNVNVVIIIYYCRHVSKLTVYFKSEYFISLQRSELYGPFDLLANFGGLLGLFNGFSLLSLVEIVYYLTLRLWCSINL